MSETPGTYRQPHGGSRSAFLEAEPCRPGSTYLRQPGVEPVVISVIRHRAHRRAPLVPSAAWYPADLTYTQFLELPRVPHQEAVLSPAHHVA